MGFVKDPVIIPRRVAVEPTPTVLPTSGPLQPWNRRNTPDLNLAAHRGVSDQCDCYAPVPRDWLYPW